MKYIVFLVIIGVLSLLFLQFHLQNKIIPIPVFINSPSTLKPDQTTTILLGGDVMLGRSVTREALDVKHDPTFPFTNLTSLFQEADIVFVNLEAPIISDCPRSITGMIFCAPPQMLQGLEPYKTIVNLANNHSANHGADGLTQTNAFLQERNIMSTRASVLITKKINQTTFGFLGFDKNQQVNPVLIDSDRTLIVGSKSKVDVLIVAMHWGLEYKPHPTDGQKRLAEELVSLGANVVVGHHPHWVQDVEKIGETPVYYSLGNLVFDQLWSEETRHGLLVKLTFDGKKIQKEELIPTYIKEVGQPIIMPSPNE